METPSQPKITELLKAWSDGDRLALAKLQPLVEGELYRRAQRYLARERHTGTLQPTALVNELYVRLIGSKNIRLQDRAHFYNLSSRIMRRILVGFFKKGEFRVNVPWDQTVDRSSERSPDLVALDDALNALAEIDPRKSQIVELRFFGGRSIKETAEALGVSADTVEREWRVARIWLLRELNRKK